MIDVINVSTGRSFATDVVMKQHVLSGKFATGFALGLLAKDVRIAADLAAQAAQAPIGNGLRDVGGARDASAATATTAAPRPTGSVRSADSM